MLTSPPWKSSEGRQQYYGFGAACSPRIITSTTGAVVSRHDYQPFGEELFVGMGSRTSAQGYNSPTDTLRQKFATYERDIETGLDYAQARYYSSMQGRFTSPDEFTGGPDELFDFVDAASDNPTFYADLTNPQSLNKYQYAYSNPLRYNDPTGHCPECALEWVVKSPSIPASVKKVAIFILAPAVIISQIPGDNTQGDGSCPSCDAYIRNYQRRLEQKEAERQNIRSQDNSENQDDSSSPPQNSDRPKPEATGTTSSGRPTDRYGNPLGPSGREMIRNRDHPSRSRAQEAARRRGKGAPEKHPNPTRGRGHFHPTGRDGKKVPNSTHENYPPRSSYPKKKKTPPNE